ncbi:hypothetical protein ACFW04_010057 [Cataglyphis niger]
MFRRRIVTTLGPVSVSGWMDRGCPQSEVLSPLLVFAQEYEDDLAIVVRESLADTSWVYSGGTYLGRYQTDTKSEKYLGVILDRKLIWKETGTLGAMKTTPITAMGMLLNIEPLCHTVIAVAASMAYHLKSNMGQDKMLAIQSALKAPFKVWFPERENWLRLQGSVLKNGFILFTDGSRIGSGSGAGVHCRGKRINKKWADALAFARTAVLRALEAPTVTSKLILDCRCILGKLARDNEVAYQSWLGGCIGGIEVGGRNPCSLGKGKIGRWLRDQHLASWRELADCRQAKALLGDSSRKSFASCIKKVSRREARLVTRILTRHGTFNYHSHKLGISMRSNCRKCEEGRIGGNQFPCAM